MQPIASPVETIDSTIGSSAVAGSQIERAVLERIGLDHHHLAVRVAVVLIGSKGHVAVDAREFLELVEIADDLFRLGADALHRLGDHPGTVIAACDPKACRPRRSKPAGNYWGTPLPSIRAFPAGPESGRSRV